MSGKSKFHIFALSLALSIVLSVAGLAQAGSAAPGGSTAAAPNTGGAPNAAPAPVGTKIGIVNIQDAIIATNEGKKEFDALQQRFAPKQNDLKALNDEVEKMKADLQAKGDKLNEDERAKQVKLLEAKQKTLQRNFDDAQSEFQTAEQEVVNRIGQKMMAVMEKYGKANGYAVIMDVANPQTPVLWFSQGNYITKDIVDAYNAEAPTAPPSAPTPKTSGANHPPASTTPKKP